MNRRVLAAFFLSSSAALLAACGNGDASSSAAPIPSPATATATIEPSHPTLQPPASLAEASPADATTVAARVPGDGSGRPGIVRPPRIDPADYASSVERDVTYCTVNGEDLLMDVYYPRTLTGDLETAVIYVHGGGWSAGDKTAGEGIQDMPELLRRGYVVFAVNYRLAPDDLFPAMIEDVKCAVRSIRANADDWGIDPDNIGAWGGSAGGHLVNMLGTTDEDDGFEGDGGYEGVSSRVQAVVSYFGPADFTTSFTGGSEVTLANIFGITTGNGSPESAAVSPVTYATSDDPPFTLFQGTEDILVWPDQSQRMYNALVAAGVEATLTMVENAGHGFVPSGGVLSPTRNEITQSMADFFDAHLR